MKNETIGDRIKATRKELNISNQKGLAKLVGVSYVAVSQWERGETEPTGGNLMLLAKALGVRAEWLTSGELPKRNDGQEPPVYVTQAEPNSYVVAVLDAKASAGNGVAVFNEVDETISSIIYENDKAMEIFGHRPAESMRVITVVGDSMSGTIETGDNIFVDIAKDYFDGDGIYVFKFKGSLMVKRLQFTADGLLVRSDNPKYADWLIREENEQYLKVMGRVIYTHSVTRYV